MADTPIFAATPRVGMVVISTANTNRDGSGTIGTVLTAGASGTRIEHIDIKGTGTTTAGMVRLYIHDGSSARLWKEVVVTAITVAASTAAFEASVDCSTPDICLFLPTSYSLRASTHNAESFNVIAVGADA